MRRNNYTSKVDGVREFLEYYGLMWLVQRKRGRVDRGGHLGGC